ncbi:histidine kinase [Terrabacter sp. Soil811]|uniref:sensor histidine kinase n=1 Tax=Terrabacter sp. Soil811 TaxID=1736419 RepID=UPI0006FCA17E|nr:histidine kinase [Terrabacter sp. Soil811]KRF48996.1 histidine kinase [Terrabacter sp. Soil811]
MDGRWTALVARVRAYFGVDTDWERVPDDSPRQRRADLWVALGFLVAGSLGVELLRSIDSLGAQQDSWVWPHVAVALGTLPLIWRHRWPLLVAAGLSLHLFVFGLLMPAVAVSMPMQVVYFLALFTGVAWARDRQAMLGVVAGVVLLMFGWLAWQLAVGSGVEEAMSRGDEPLVHQGLFSPAGAYVVYTLLINVFYFGGAIIGGQAAWRAALQRDRLAAQARTIDAQATSLQRQAVVEERLRIARELHDVVAHHVSVIGIQAAAARRVLRRDPDAAEGALRSVETSSRDAVAQMRGLLGTLRADDHEGTSDGSGPGGRTRAPEPGLADVTTLAREASTHGLEVECHVVEDVPGAAASVPAPLGLSLYRTAQEALANVRRHSTASSATVFVRVDRRPEHGFAHGYAEVEVLDGGRPRSGTSGTGLGLLGVRERLSTHGGVSEIGPRVTGGYRVRVRMPLPEEAS